MKTFAAAITACFLAILAAPGEAGAQVQACTHKLAPITDEHLAQAVASLLRQHPELVVQTDDAPCRHARETARAIFRTVGRDHLKHLTGHEVVKLINGESYFTVERFRSAAPGELQKLAGALDDVRGRKLRSEANTVYAYFLSDDSLILMISSAAGREANAALFAEIQRGFPAPAQ
ncbi:hypothetical protein [Azonexus sp.]|uniref:hypothetical protein n=1 Tax=Azonexus sp. TaxID=1872668 RepID=UPI0035B2968A